MKPTFWNRFRRYPLSCVGHIVQGVAAGLLVAAGLHGALAGALWAYLFVQYQSLSFQRKRDWEGRGDTAGLDTMDFLVGYVLAVGGVTLAWLLVGGPPGVRLVGGGGVAGG